MSVQKRIKKKVASTLGIGTKNKVGKVRHQIRKGLTDVAKDTLSAGGKAVKKTKRTLANTLGHSTTPNKVGTTVRKVKSKINQIKKSKAKNIKTKR